MTQIMRSLVLSLFIVTLTTELANAEATQMPALRQLRTFQFLIENLNEYAARCGIDQSGLDTEIRYIFGQSKIKLIPSMNTDGILYLNVLVQPDCVADISLQVSTMATIQRSKVTRMVTVWSTGGSVGSDGIASSLDKYAKEFVNDWNAANR